MRAIRLLLISAGVVALLVQGCVLPSKTVHSAVYRGRVLDAETRQPVSKARVEVRGGYYLTASSKSDSSGAFAVGPLDCWRFYFYFPSPEGRVPMECGHVIDSEHSKFLVDVSRSGYEPASILVPVSGTNWSGEFVVGDIPLHQERRR